MASFTLTDAVITFGTVTLSGFCKSITVNYKSELQDDTAMGDAARSRVGGLIDWDVSMELFQQDADSFDEALFGYVGAVKTLTVKRDSASTSDSNPSYSGSGILQDYSPITGNVGDVAMAPLTIMAAGTVLTRATA